MFNNRDMKAFFALAALGIGVLYAILYGIAEVWQFVGTLFLR